MDATTELAQQLFNKDGNPGNLYRKNPDIVKFYEDKAIEILKEE